jgi:hypothetical protein
MSACWLPLRGEEPDLSTSLSWGLDERQSIGCCENLIPPLLQRSRRLWLGENCILLPLSDGIADGSIARRLICSEFGKLALISER